MTDVEMMTPASAGANFLGIKLDGRLYRFDEANYETLDATKRRAVNALLDHLVVQTCRKAPLRSLAHCMETLAEEGSRLRTRAASQAIKTLLSGEPRMLGKDRFALLFLLHGLMDVHWGADTAAKRFLLCVVGIKVKQTISPFDNLDLLPIVLKQFRDLRIWTLFSPATLSLLTVFTRLARPDLDLTVRLSELRTMERPRYLDLSWQLSLRLGLFLFDVVGLSDQTKEHITDLIKADFIRAVISGALADGLRDRDNHHPQLMERVRKLRSRRLGALALQVAFEDDPTDFRLRTGNGAAPYLFRRVRPPERTETVMASDGSEIIGYKRSVDTGDIVAVQRNSLTAPLRGSRSRFRWNNEPVLRVSFSDSVVSPSGLILFGDDAILDFEFANLPNRSGSALDRYHIATHPELILSNDRSAVIVPFPDRKIDRGVLLSGIPYMANYGHFLVNGTSKFPLLRKYYNDGWSVIVPGKRAKFHDEIIEYCGLDAARFIFTNSTHGINVGQLDVISEAPLGVMPYNLVAALRAELPRIQPKTGARRIYLARPEDARRSLVNEAELIDLLSQFDFSVVRPESLPFREQVALMEAADTIVAPHGSALHTLIFCFGKKRIIEIETKVSIWSSQFNFLGHEDIKIPSRMGRCGIATWMEQVDYAVDLDAARAAVTWAVGR